jgi:hypothetical protein
MLIFTSNNFHLWSEEFQDLAIKIKVWKYIDSYDKIEESEKEILFEIFHFVVKITVSSITDDLMTNQTSQFAQSSQSRFVKWFHELIKKQQNNYRANVKKYKRKEKQILKLIQRMFKIHKTIRASVKT